MGDCRDLRRGWVTAFHQGFALVEANLDTRKCQRGHILALAFHIGLFKWKPICSHNNQTESCQTWQPPRQALRGAVTQRRSRFLVSKRGFQPHKVEGEPFASVIAIRQPPNYSSDLSGLYPNVVLRPIDPLFCNASLIAAKKRRHCVSEDFDTVAHNSNYKN